MLIFLLSAPTIAHASGYGIGSAGYLYEDCKRVLASAKSFKDAHNSYCGAFIEGYVMGLMVSHTSALPEANQADPCYRDKQKAYSHINGRFCRNLPKFQTSGSAGEALETIASLLGKWAAFNQDKLNQDLPDALDNLLSPGAFCRSFNQITPSPLRVNSALKNTGWTEILGAKSLVSLSKKRKQCQDDIVNVRNSPIAFKATKCGAEIMGFMTGTRGAVKLRETQPKVQNPKCEKPIQRLYSGLDATQTMCVNTKTQPLTIARIFTRNYELIAGQSSLWNKQGIFDSGALGAVGYETIYRGFVCRNSAELQKRKR